MKALIVRTGAFLAGIFLLMLSFSIFYAIRIRDKDNYFILWNSYRRYPNNIRVLFLGDSHPSFDLRNQELPEGYYNFAYPGESVYDWYFKLIRVHKDNPTLETVVIPFDCHNFSEYRSTQQNIKSILYFSRLSDTFRILPDYSRFELFKVKLGTLVPILNAKDRELLQSVIIEDIYSFLTGRKNKKQIYVDGSGNLVDPDIKRWDEYPENERVRRASERLSTQLGKGISDKKLIKVFKELADYCRTNNLNLVGVQYPLSVEYNRLSRNYGIEELNSIYRGAFHNHQLDYRELFNGNQEYFRNQDHLNIPGALVFTRHIADDLELYGKAAGASDNR